MVSYVRAANIQTSNGRTNRPITKLFPLEVTATNSQADEVETVDVVDTPQRPKRNCCSESITKNIEMD